MSPTFSDGPPADASTRDAVQREAALTLQRRRFDAAWSARPDILVLAALPGYGRTTWMRHVAASDRGRRAVWLRSRPELRAYSAQGGAPGALLLIDDMVGSAADDAWLDIAKVVRSHPDVTVVVAA